MLKHLTLLIAITSLFACSRSIKFDRRLWNDESDRGFYENRNAMLDDLLQNQPLKGMHVEELEHFFGYIEYDSTMNQKDISFEVYQEWEGIDPSYTKYLHLRLNADNRVDSVYTSEYRR